MLKLRYLLVLFFCLSFVASNSTCHTKWHSYAYSGYAWSKKANFTNPDSHVFTVSPSGNDDNAFSHVPYAGIALHHTVLAGLELGFSYDCYAVLAFQKFHSFGNSYFPVIVKPGQEVLYKDYQRQFSLQHQTVMCDLFLNLPEKWRVVYNYFVMEPLLGCSIGLGINNMFNFQTITPDVVFFSTDVTTISNNIITKNFAWRLEAGLKFSSQDSNIAFGVSYRYDDGGKFHSGTRYMLNDGINNGQIYNLPAWTGVFKSNQIKLYINVNFD